MIAVDEDRDPVAQRILDAAIVSIDAQGEVGLRVQDVVLQAGVQIPILYRHFGNREGLVQAAQLERLRRDLAVEIEVTGAMLGSAESAVEFRAILDAVLNRVMSEERRLPRSRRVNVMGSTYGRPELTAAVARSQHVAIDWIAGVLTRPAERGWIRQDIDLRVFATWLAGTMIGRFVAELDTESIDMAVYDQMWLDSIHHTLFG